MKNTLKKLLVAAGICAASTSAFADEHTYFVEIVNNYGQKIYANYEEGGSYEWDGSNGGIDGAKEMTGANSTWMDSGVSDFTATRDNYHRGRDDVKYFSITIPTGNNKGRKVIFHINNRDGSGDVSAGDDSRFYIGANYVSDSEYRPFWEGDHDRDKVRIVVNPGGNFTVDIGKAPIKDGWLNPNGTTGFCQHYVRPNYGYAVHVADDSPQQRCFASAYADQGKDPNQQANLDYWYQGHGYSSNFNSVNHFDVDLPNTPAPAPTPVASAIHDFGDWSGDKPYRVEWYPKQIFPVVHYNGKSWIACSDATAGAIPGNQSAGWNSWVEYNGNPSQCGGAKASLKAAAPAPVKAPQGTYNFGQWKAGEYPVVYSPREVHPFVTYNGKGYVACSGDTTANDVPGKSAAWKEVNGTLGNTCNYTVHSAKKQSTTPSIAKAGVSFW